MEHLIEYLFYGVYATAFAFLLLVLYINKTNQRLNYLLRKINKLSDTDENEGFPKSKIHHTRTQLLRFVVKIQSKLNDMRIRRIVYEYLEGANLITVIGSILFIVGIGFFVRFPVFGDYLNIISRVVMAITGSLLLIIVSHSMHRRHPAFSSIIMGAALSILYFTFVTAYYNYNLFGAAAAFFIAFFITAFSVLLSLAYNRFSLVTLSFLAGFSTPFLVGYDNSDIFLLFNYLLLLDVGVLVVVLFHKRLFLNIAAFAFSGIYFLIWLIICMQTGYYEQFELGFLYLIIFYLILLPINSLTNIIQKKIFLPFELSVLITLNMLVYAAGMYMLYILNPDYRGLFTALIAVFNLLYLYILLKYIKQNQRLVYLLIGLVVVFVSLVPPVELVGRSISMVWALQLVLLLWISQKVDVVLMKMGAFLISLALIFNTFDSLFDVLATINPFSEPKALLINIDFISGFLASVALLASAALASREKGKYLFKPLKVKLYQVFAGASAVILLYFSLFIEVKYQLTTHVASQYARQIYMGIFNFSFIALPVIATAFISEIKIKKVGAYASVIILAGYFVFYYLVTIRARGELIADGGIRLSQFFAVYFIDIIVAAVMYVVYENTRLAISKSKLFARFTLWPLLIFIYIALSFSLDHYWVVQNARQGVMVTELLEEAHRLPYTVMWSVLALIMTVFGTFVKIRQLRQFSLFAVLVLLVKMFVHDMGAMNTEQRTIGMIIVGSVLLAIAMIYQFNKKKFEAAEM